MMSRRPGGVHRGQGPGRCLGRGRAGCRLWEMLLGTSLLSLCGLSAVLSALAAPWGVQAAPWNQDEDLAALGSLDSLLAFEDIQAAVQQAEESWGQPPVPGSPAGVPRTNTVSAVNAPWQPAEPDPQLYLLTEYDRGGRAQTRVKRNREAAAAAAAAGRIAAASRGNGLRRHVRNPPGSSGQRLSIVNPLDVLRQRLLLEIARRRKASVPQSNREMLEGIGKRSWSSSPVTITIEQQLERCLAQLSDTIKPQDKLARLALLYKAIQYGKCDLTNDMSDQPDPRQQQQQQQQQQQLNPTEVRSQEQEETNHLTERERDDQEDWSARQPANGWSRNARAATNSNLTS